MDMKDQNVLSFRIGSRLSCERSKAGLTIADVAALTKISSRYLVAIERGDFGLLPSRVHALGFTRAFAKAVNVDEVEVVEALRTKLACRSPSYSSAMSRETEPRSKRGRLSAAVRAVTAMRPNNLKALIRTAIR